MSNEIQVIRNLRQHPPVSPYGEMPTDENLARKAWEKGFDTALSMAETLLENSQRKAQQHPYLENEE